MFSADSGQSKNFLLCTKQGDNLRLSHASESLHTESDLSLKLKADWSLFKTNCKHSAGLGETGLARAQSADKRTDIHTSQQLVKGNAPWLHNVKDAQFSEEKTKADQGEQTEDHGQPLLSQIIP